jgi:hypothetical protein
MLHTPDQPDITSQQTSETVSVSITPILSTSATNMSYQIDFANIDSELAFAILESDFADNKVTAESKKFHILRKLLAANSQIITPPIRKLFLDEPAELPYTTLKEEYLRAGRPIDYEELRKALEKEQPAGMKPSEFLDRLGTLADLKGKYKNNEIVQKSVERIWLNSLPKSWVFVISNTLQTNSIENTARFADSLAATEKLLNLPDASAVFAATASPGKPADHFIPQVSAVHSSHSLSMKQMQEQINKLSSAVDNTNAELANVKVELAKIAKQLNHPTNQRGRSTSHSGNNYRGSSASRDKSVNDVPLQDKRTLGSDGACWYHRTHGAATRSCVEGCKHADIFQGQIFNQWCQAKNSEDRSQ